MILLEPDIFGGLMVTFSNLTWPALYTNPHPHIEGMDATLR